MPYDRALRDLEACYMSNATDNRFYREPMIVAHSEGADTKLHLLDQPCANCRPPIVITDEMIDRAMDAYCGIDRAKGNRHDFCGCDDQSKGEMRAALEAALNG